MNQLPDSNGNTFPPVTLLAAPGKASSQESQAQEKIPYWPCAVPGTVAAAGSGPEQQLWLPLPHMQLWLGTAHERIGLSPRQSPLFANLSKQKE